MTIPKCPDCGRVDACPRCLTAAQTFEQSNQFEGADVCQMETTE